MEATGQGREERLGRLRDKGENCQWGQRTGRVWTRGDMVAQEQDF